MVGGGTKSLQLYPSLTAAPYHAHFRIIKQGGYENIAKYASFPLIWRFMTIIFC